MIRSAASGTTRAMTAKTTHPSRRRRFRKILLGLCALAALIVALGLFGSRLLRGALIPSEPFSAQTPGPAPDYTRSEAWAALPSRKDGADVLPLPKSEDRQARADADVFFLHAGANMTSRWNQAVDQWLVRNLVDAAMMPMLASAFNGCCRVYAPRFRQEAILRNPALEAERQKAVAFAYEDVRRAFRHYLEHDNGGRPLIVAGANSGGRHGLRLLIEEVAGKPVQKQLVAAYLVATHVDAAAREQLGTISICDAPDQIGCVNVYSAVGRQMHARWPPPPERRGDACVNPLSWRADGRHVPRTHNPASIAGATRSVLLGAVAEPKAMPPMADAQCLDGQLVVTPNELLADSYQPGGPGDYHSLNIQLFYGSIRDNAIARTRAFLQRRTELAHCPPEAETATELAAEHARLPADGCSAGAPTNMPGSLGNFWPGALPAALR
jgi:hypothetical protein